jgi:alkylation response protein AidB-like acyl-CoA dehydrogenase
MKYERETRGQNFFDLDRNVQKILTSLNPMVASDWSVKLSEFGDWVGSELDEEAEYTDRFAPPVLDSYTRDGVLTNHIRLNPFWEKVEREVYRRGVIGHNYGASPAPFLLTFTMGYLISQSDMSLHCPVTMTGAVAYVLERFAPPAVRDRYLGELTRTDGLALTGGTWVTELHGGSDVGATTTVARAEGDHFRLTGLKWFTSNANGGLAIATARPEGAPDGTKGLGLYLVPTHLEDGTPNPMRIRRLKDKLGTRGVPTGEIDLENTWAVEIAPPPQGFKLMMEALEFSRIHNAMSAAGISRRAFLEAVSYMSHREAFGKPVFGFPMVRDELLNMLVRLEASCALSFSAAQSFDVAHVTELSDDDVSRAWMRMVTALAKYRTAEDANVLSRAAIEIIGGNAYTYDYVTPRLMRDAQVLTVWEGPANIQALEVLRMIGNRYPGFEALSENIGATTSETPELLSDISARIDGALVECNETVIHLRNAPADGPKYARKLMDRMAHTLAASLLLDEATRDLKNGDARKSLVAALYVRDHLAIPARRIVDEASQIGDDLFEALIGYEPVIASKISRQQIDGLIAA